ncbi:TlpA family protein disulfide reductase [Pseudohaliea rubra]|uniref:Thioredoxin n=1 Tax=Pseudohaliea rubra DSM 19751 TaxID=1265313 RepID=A0A095VUZ7_9GAMM|nr:TlpA disulfide reductase family protein [Pseudohaliea rubra]KGE05287.1 Thioredoxin [Pseudohaliea rubra DSM 19751]
MTLPARIACLTLSLGLTLGVAGCGERPGALGPIEEQLGSWVLVNYWAEWCKPCIREIPELNSLDGEDDIAVLGVNYDGVTGDALAAQIDALDIRFAQLPTDPAADLGIDRPQVLPTTVVIDPDGRRVATLLGPQTAESLREAMAGSGG